MKKHFLWLLLFTASLAKAKSIAGADISYRSLSLRKFEITLKVYRLCTDSSYQNPASFGIVCASGGTSRQLSCSKVSIRDVSDYCKGESPCTQNTIGSGSGIEEHCFVDTIDFNVSPFSNDIANGCCAFKIFFSECCRNSSVNTGTGADFYLDALIDVCQGPANSSPRFTVAPYIDVCYGSCFVMDFGVKDNEQGDSLVCSLVAAKISDSLNFNYASGYNSANPVKVYNPLPGNHIVPTACPPMGFFINPKYGEMIFSPVNPGDFGPVVISLEEFRKDSSGIYRKIGMVKREILLRTNSCYNNAPLISKLPEVKICEGDERCISFQVSDNRFILPPPQSSPPADSLEISWDSSLAGASFFPDSITRISSNTSYRNGKICWTAPAGSARVQPYRVTVKVSDKHCPVPARTAYTYSFRVFPNVSSTRNVSLLSCGRLSVQASPDSNVKALSWYVLDSTGKDISLLEADKRYSNNARDTFQFRKSGKYIIQLAIAAAENQCVVYYRDTLTVSVALQVSIGKGLDTLVCRNDTAMFISSVSGHIPPLKYKWSGYTQSASDSAPDYRVFAGTAGNIRLKVWDASGCSNSADLAVKLSGSFWLGFDKGHCTDTIQLAGPAGWKKYNWNNNPADTLITFKASSPGDYSLKTLDTLGCSFSDTIRIRNSDPFKLSSDTVLCASDSITLRGPDQWISYQWSTGNTEKDIRIGKGGQYILIAKDTVLCSYRDTLLVKFYSPAPALHIDDTMICKGSIIELDPGQFSSYSWNTGETSRKLSVINSGKYVVKVVDSIGCKASDSSIILMDSIPPFSILDSNIAAKKYTFRSTLKGPYFYYWDFGDGFYYADTQSTHQYQFTNKYKVCLILTDSFKCQRKECISLQIVSAGDEIDDLHLEIYPNPAESFIRLELLHRGGRLNISCFDPLGREYQLLGSEGLGPGYINEVLDLSSLPSGIYVFRVFSGNSIANYRLIKR